MERRKYKIKAKVVGNEKPIVTDYIGSITTEELINKYGLDLPDVEWYDIEWE